MSDDHTHPGLKHHVPLSDRAKRAIVIHRLLVSKNIVRPDEVRETIDRARRRTPADGARVVARAWTDPAFKTRLMDDPRSAVFELGYRLSRDAELAVLENTDRLHHLVVCTLCSCYPTSLLGQPPDWYKSFAYRQRAVVEPRAVMREFGLHLGEDVVVRVVDSTADLRYLVLPRRPSETEGMPETELAELVTRDSMIGVGEARRPA
ncbi:MAG: nitrile hydratase subunit alpha [Gammaproteobacteria bacterium]|nr:nitrile hydratase subunit alpha [Gammaproteobacteria bacterium]